ncbi:MAG: tRNA-dihydrouridine synthase [Parasporobacterium sp.]|nr:tRNA-dihydrouridine synthase [Parasporobacterium sp.]
MSTLQQRIGSIVFRSPVTVGAGPLTGRLDLLKKAADCGAGAVSIKQTPFSQPRPGVRKMYAERGGYFFNPSDTRLDYRETVDMVKAIKDTTDMAVLVNILGDGANVDSWIFLADLMEQAGADGVELNFACPNPPDKLGNNGGGYQYGASISQYPDLAGTVISGLTSAVRIPVWVKFSGEGTDTAALSRTAQKSGAAGMVAFCSPRGAFPIDIYQGGRPKMAAMQECSFGGINGPGIRKPSQRIVAEAYKAAPSLPIIGGGGISKPEHAIETIMFGADLIFMHTQIMLEGFEIIPKFNDFLLRFMEEQGYDTISQMKGLALKHEIPANELDYTIGPPAQVDTERCVGCGTCAKIAFCRSITLEDGKAKVDPALCECCGLCASLCPKQAIRF